MDEEALTETVMHPDREIVLAVTGELRELICSEIPMYWYSWLAIKDKAA